MKMFQAANQLHQEKEESVRVGLTKIDSIVETTLTTDTSYHIYAVETCISGLLISNFRKPPASHSSICARKNAFVDVYHHFSSL